MAGRLCRARLRDVGKRAAQLDQSMGLIGIHVIKTELQVIQADLTVIRFRLRALARRDGDPSQGRKAQREMEQRKPGVQQRVPLVEASIVRHVPALFQENDA